MMLEKKMYVLVRKDLSKSQQAVQSGHAIASYLINNPKTKWNNGTLVYLQVHNEEELLRWVDKINSDIALFREPDIGNEATALATLSYGDEFRELKLL